MIESNEPHCCINCKKFHVAKSLLFPDSTRLTAWCDKGKEFIINEKWWTYCRDWEYGRV